MFEVAAGSGAVTTLASFNGTSNGCTPYSGLVADSSGNLYGTTMYGGSAGDGTVFEVAAGSSAITTLASFNGTNGANPYGSLVVDSSGNLFGTTGHGGPGNIGTVFKVAVGSGNITTLVSFNGANGCMPLGGLVEDGSGNLYGTTGSGGSGGDGTVFKIAASGGALTTLASFNGTNGAVPLGSLVLGGSGNLFGTTSQDGPSNDGTVFEVAANGAVLTNNTAAGLVFDVNQGFYLGTGGLTVDTACSAKNEFKGALSGPGALTLANDPNNGCLVLAANNTYQGGTVIPAAYAGCSVPNKYSLVIGDGLTVNGNLPGNLIINANANNAGGTGCVVSVLFNSLYGQSYGGTIYALDGGGNQIATSGNVVITKAGNATLTLTGNNSLYMGNIALAAGILNVNSDLALGCNTSVLAFGNATLQAAGNITFDPNRAFLANVGNVALIDTQGFSVTYGNSAGNSGLAGCGTLVAAGSGNLTLVGTSNFAGNTVVAGGNLVVACEAALGLVPANYVSNQLMLDGGTLVEAATPANSSYLPLSLNRGIYLNIGGGTLTADAGTIFTLPDAITGPGGLTVGGNSGDVHLQGNNTYLGNTLVSGGRMFLENAYGNTSVPGNLIVNGGTAWWAASGNQISPAAILQVVSGTADIWNYPVSVAGVQLLGANAAINNFSEYGMTGVLTSATPFDMQAGSANAVLAGNVGLNKTRGGTVTLTGNNIFTGPTSVANGVLQVGAAGGALGCTSAVNITAPGDLQLLMSNQIYDDANVTITGGTLDMGCYTDTVYGVTLTGNGVPLTGNGSILGGTGSLLTSLTDFNLQSGSVTAGLGGNVNLVKNESGCSAQDTVTLSGNDSYTGNTTVVGGTLLLDNTAGGLTVPGNLTVDANTTALLLAGNQIANTAVASVAGTLNVNGQTQGIDQLTGGGLVTLGNAAGNLTVGVAGGSSEFDGVISGNGSLTKAGAGTFTLTGNNTFSGNTVVTGGCLVLDATGGNLALGGTGNVVVTAGSVELLSSNQINPAAAVSVAAPGTFNVNGQSQGVDQLTGSGCVTLGTTAAGSLNVGVAGDSSEFDGSIAGNGSLTKVGAGNFTYAGNGSYSGNTTVSGGNLILGNGASNGSLAGNIVDNAGLVFDNAFPLVVASPISGNGTLTAAGPGLLTLLGNETYTGLTTVNAPATLQIGNAATAGGLPGNVIDNGNLGGNGAVGGCVTVNGTLWPGLGTGSTTFTVGGNLSFGNHSFFVVTANGAASDQVNVGGCVSVANGATLQLAVTGNPRGTSYQVLNPAAGRSIVGNFTNSYGNVLTQPSGNITLSGVLLQYNYQAGLNHNSLYLNTPASYTWVWTGGAGGGNVNFSDPFNWVLQGGGGNGTPANGNALIFNTTGIAANAPVNDEANLSLASLTFSTGNVGYSLGGNSLTISGTGGLVDQAGNQVLTLNVGTASNVQTISVSAGNQLTLAGGVTFDSAVNLSGAGTVLIDGGDGGTGCTVTLGAGTLQLGNGTAAGVLAGNIVDNSRLVLDNGCNVSFSGALSGNGSLTKMGAGNFTLAAAGALGGNVTVSGGGLIMAANLAVGGCLAVQSGGSGSVACGAVLSALGGVTVGGTLAVNGNLSGAVPTVVSGTGCLTGNGTVTTDVSVLSGAALGGNLTVAGGNLSVAAGANVNPGDGGFGMLTISTANTPRFAAGANFNLQVGGNQAGVTYDQITITGDKTVNVANVSLSVTDVGNYVPVAPTNNTLGDHLVLINNVGSGGLVGNFVTANASGPGNVTLTNAAGLTVGTAGMRLFYNDATLGAARTCSWCARPTWPI